MNRFCFPIFGKSRHCNPPLILLLVLGLGNLHGAAAIAAENDKASPPAGQSQEASIDVLLITGGGFHDYDFQAKALQLALQKQGLKINWTVVNDGGTGKKAEIKLYDDPQWAAAYDVVIHNECFADTTTPEYIRKITKGHHDGANAIVIHCAMHTYRSATIDDWREFLGVTTRRHDHQSNYPVTVKDAAHPVMKHVPTDYVSATDELYIIEKRWPKMKVLATSKSEATGKEHPVFWTNQYGKSKVFGTSYGHSNETFEDEVFLKVLGDAVVWLSQ